MCVQYMLDKMWKISVFSPKYITEMTDLRARIILGRGDLLGGILY